MDATATRSDHFLPRLHNAKFTFLKLCNTTIRRWEIVNAVVHYPHNRIIGTEGPELDGIPEVGTRYVEIVAVPRGNRLGHFMRSSLHLHPFLKMISRLTINYTAKNPYNIRAVRMLYSNKKLFN
jgi:hypothetical protein